MHKWLEDLRPYLYKKDDDYSTLVERGYVMHRTTKVLPTEFHGCALRDGLVGDFDWENPIPIDIYIDYEIPSGMDDLDTSQYDVSIDSVLKKDRMLARDILATISSKSEYKTWEKSAKSNGTISGLALLPLLHEEKKKGSDATNHKALNKMHGLVERGVPVVLVSRDQTKLEALASDLQSEFPGASCRLIAHDFAGPAGGFYAKVAEVIRRDVALVVNNVGVVCGRCPRVSGERPVTPHAGRRLPFDP